MARAVGGVWIANPLAAALFAGTPLEKAWHAALRALPGVIPGERLTFAGVQMRTLWVPEELLATA